MNDYKLARQTLFAAPVISAGVEALQTSASEATEHSFQQRGRFESNHCNSPPE